MSEVKQETIDAIKLMILGSMLCDYGARLMVDDTKQSLKYRVKCVMNAVKNVEMQFINDNRTTEEYRKAFKRSFNRNETVLLADLNLVCWQLNEESIEEIINAIKKVMHEA
jgi:hypothetical protein